MKIQRQCVCACYPVCVWSGVHMCVHVWDAGKDRLGFISSYGEQSGKVLGDSIVAAKDERGGCSSQLSDTVTKYLR